MLFVSHNMSAVTSLCERGILLEQGRVAFDGPVAETLERYSASSDAPLAHRPHAPDAPRIVDASIDHARAARGEIVVRVSFSSPRLVDTPKLGIVARAGNGAPVFGFNTDMDPSFRPQASHGGTFELHLSDAPIHTGTYRLTIWFGESSTTMTALEDALTFSFVAPTSVPPGVSIDYIGHTRLQGRFTFEEKTIS